MKAMRTAGAGSGTGCTGKPVMPRRGRAPDSKERLERSAVPRPVWPLDDLREGAAWRLNARSLHRSVHHPEYKSVYEIIEVHISKGGGKILTSRTLATNMSTFSVPPY